METVKIPIEWFHVFERKKSHHSHRSICRFYLLRRSLSTFSASSQIPDSLTASAKEPAAPGPSSTVLHTKYTTARHSTLFPRLPFSASSCFESSNCTYNIHERQTTIQSHCENRWNASSSAVYSLGKPLALESTVGIHPGNGFARPCEGTKTRRRLASGSEVFSAPRTV